MKLTKNLRVILLASLLFLAACGENGTGPVDPGDGNADAVEVRISTSLGIWASGADASEGLSAQGVPVDPETGESGVAQAELEVFDAEGERLFFRDAQPVSEGEGKPVIFTPRDNTVTLALSPDTYTFFASATDEREPTNELARGLAENVQIRAGADNRVNLAFTSLLGQVTFNAPETVEANAVFDAFLAVSPPGRPDLRVSEGDYEVEYSVTEPSEQLSSSQIGVRVAAGCATTQVSATVSNQPPREERTQIGAQTGISVRSEVCSDTGTDVGTDLVPPFVSFSDLEDGDTLPLSLTLAGEANDRQSGIERVEVYEGTAKLGDAELDDSGRLTAWRFDYTAEREGEFTFIAVAFDKAGNSSRVEVKVKVDKDDTSSQEVEIPDDKLEQLIRDAISKPEGDLTRQDLEEVEVIEFEGLNLGGKNTVQDLTGLQFATNLRRLDLPFNGVANLDPLLDNSGFGEGDSLNLFFNPLDTCPGTEDRNAIDALLERGVQVAFDDPQDCDAAGPITVTSTSGAASLENACTLRAAITAANTDQAVGGCSAGDGEDTVVLDNRATYTLNEVDNEREVESGFSFANGLPIITSNITLEGNGATIERQDGSPAFRILEIAKGGDLGLERVTLQGGGGEFIGGGIYNAGRTFVSLSVIRANGLIDFSGGGIYNTGIFSLSSSDVVENEGVQGAGVYNTGTFTAFESRIDNNEGVNSGGLTNEGDMTLESSSISGNSTDDSRGAVLNTETGVFTARSAVISGNSDDGITFENQGEAHFSSTVYSGNSRELWNGGTMTITKSAIVRSGGVENFGTLTLTNSTLSNLGRTLRDFDASVLNRDGGTLSLSYSTVASNERSLINEAGTLTLTSSIVADTGQEDQDGGPNCVGSITSEGYNLDSDGSCNLDQATDLSNVDPQLGALQDNGEETQTQALQEGSPAIDAVPTDVCTPGTDQRVVPRPQGEACDIGAFEKEQ